MFEVLQLPLGALRRLIAPPLTLVVLDLALFPASRVEVTLADALGDSAPELTRFPFVLRFERRDKDFFFRLRGDVMKALAGTELGRGVPETFNRVRCGPCTGLRYGRLELMSLAGEVAAPLVLNLPSNLVTQLCSD